MNEKLTSEIKLRTYLTSDYGLGNVEGRDVLHKLQKYLSTTKDQKIFSISMIGIKGTDASFPRESVISLIKMLNTEIGFYLCDFPNQDMIDNWNYAAQAKGQSVIVKLQKGYQIIGPDLTPSGKELLDFIMSKGTVTTASVVAKFDVSAQNASAKLKKLYEQGLILGSKEAAETGGLEFIYTAIK